MKLSLPIFRLDFETCCFFTTVSMFSYCSKGGRAIADSDFFFLLENQITIPEPFHANILNYWDFFRRRTPPFYLSLDTSSQASSPKVSHMPWNNASLFRGQLSSNDNRYFGFEIMLDELWSPKEFGPPPSTRGVNSCQLYLWLYWLLLDKIN